MRWTRPAAGLTAVVAAIGLAACGSDSSSSGSTSAAAAPAAVKPVADIPSLSGRSTSVALNGDFVKALGTLKLTPGTIGTAKLTKAGSLVFPITGGNVKYFKPGSVSPYVQGEVDHDGSGFSLTGGGKKVDLTDFVVDPGKSVLTGKVSVDGKVAAESAPLFFLNGNTLKPLTTANGTATLEGTTVELKQEAADLLNQTFGTDALKAGLVIGVAKIVVNTA
jgi:hypothetical protein